MIKETRIGITHMPKMECRCILEQSWGDVSSGLAVCILERITLGGCYL